MTEQEKIKEEIERLYKHYIDAQEFDSGYNMALDDILQFINSIPEEPVSEDLEEAAQEYSFNIPTQLEADSVWKKETEQHFKDGVLWQKQQMKEILQTEYEKGRFDMREELMEDAVEGTVKYEIGSAEIPQCDRRYQVLSDQTPIANAKLGDKVKIIIVKTE